MHDTFEEGNGMLVGRKRGDKTRGYGPGVTWNCPTDAEIGNRRMDCDMKWLGGTISTGPATDVVRHVNGMTGAVTWDVTLDVRDALTDGETEARWLIRKARERQRGKVGYYSKEGAAAANDLSKAPRLLLEFGDEG